MRRLLLLACLALAACASQPGQAPAPSRSSSPSLAPAGPGAARLVAAAEGEWRAWGRIAVEGWPYALDRTPDATPELFERLMSYWSATPEGPEVVTAHRHFRDTITAPSAASASLDPVSGLPFEVVPANVAISSFNHPAWSAAFISYSMAQAGMPRSDFDPSASHALYVDRMIANAMADPTGAAFVPHGMTEYAPRPGDLVCADGSGVAVVPAALVEEVAGQVERVARMEAQVLRDVAAGLPLREARAARGYHAVGRRLS